MEKSDDISTGSSGRQLPGNQKSRDQLRQIGDYIRRIRANSEATARANENLSRTLDKIEQRWTKERNHSLDRGIEGISENTKIHERGSIRDTGRDARSHQNSINQETELSRKEVEQPRKQISKKIEQSDWEFDL